LARRRQGTISCSQPNRVQDDASDNRCRDTRRDRYRDYAMPVILDFGMQAAVEGKSYPQIMQDFLSGTP
jgi:hypothetical protein